MDLEVEHQVWLLMQEHFPQEIDDVLEQALVGYRRSPGYAALTRVHSAQVGALGVQALSMALHKRPLSHAEIHSSAYVELRMPLRVHLFRHLQRYLIERSRATEPVLEAFLAAEVGL